MPRFRSATLRFNACLIFDNFILSKLFFPACGNRFGQKILGRIRFGERNITGEHDVAREMGMTAKPAGSVSADNPLVSVIILNYNGLRFLKDCFDSLVKCSYPNFEILLVDNNSTDESAAFTRKNYPRVKIIQTGGNKGFSWGYNISFEHAAGKYFVLLNNDVAVDPGWLEPLVAAAEADDRIGALQPKILSMIDRQSFEYAGASGGFIDKYGYPFLRGRVFYTIEKDYGQYDNETEVFWTSGAAMFVRAEALLKSGRLDEDFVFHME